MSHRACSTSLTTQDKAVKCYRTAESLGPCDGKTLSNFSLLLYLSATRDLEIGMIQQRQDLTTLEVKYRFRIKSMINELTAQRATCTACLA
jgi:hypothetical protein